VCSYLPTEETIRVCRPYDFPTDAFFLPLMIVIERNGTIAFGAVNCECHNLNPSGHSLYFKALIHQIQRDRGWLQWSVSKPASFVRSGQL
jgi:hypothetical protein